MGEEKKLPRLGAAAKEFNVSTAGIVEILQKEGIVIEDNRNVKLTAEMYDILINKLGADKKVKEESQKLDMDFSYNKPAAKVESEKPAVAPVEDEPVILIKDNTIEREPIKVEVPKPKILGKIDLGEKKTSKKSAKTEEKPATEKSVEEKKEVPAQPASESQPEQEIQPEVQTETAKEAEPAKEEPKAPEHINIEVDNPSVKVVGKIDLNAKHSPAPPTTTETSTETVEEAPEEAAQEEVEPQPTEPKKEHIGINVEKSAGPKILGKIDLSTIRETTKKADKSAAGTPDGKKKKRKRIKQQTAVKNLKEENQKAKKPEPKVEISEEDIQRQIKETMQRLEPLGKTKAAKRRREKRQHIQEEHLEQERQELEQQKILKVTEFITANELATLMNIPVTQIISTCMSVGLFVAINQRLGAETISLLAEEFGYQVEFVGVDDGSEHSGAEEEDKPEDLQPRHPIITVMGHVDHGKTSLLDYIRKSNVIAGEAGGITQHIGAYEVTLSDGRKITFLDTPGHEAFTAMRARGARITDLCIIVIAADDSIMPQTVEAINHAQAAGVPMVFAITKIDKPHANPEKIKEGLANMNILVEEWGGKYQCQEIDAKHGTNVNELLDKVLLEAEMLDLKANPNRPGLGTVIESSLDKGKGYVAKLLIQNGTLKIGDPILAGSCYGKVKALYNERNQKVQSVGPASPVLLLGLDGAPQAGDTFKVCESEQEARSIATKRARLLREQGLRTQKHITLDEIGRRIAIGDFKELNVIVKGDVDGSVEALADSLMKLSTEQVQVNVIHKSVGQVTESDVLLASASNAVIVAFQVRPSAGARKLAEKEQIDLRTYSIIYDAIEEIKSAMECMLAPKIREKVLCNIEIKEVFKISKVGSVAGCIVLDGKLQRTTKVRLIRDGIVIYT
ncbi:MAG: translation initiation factor IF-2, partial [Bacteroidales bacterium]|nr:translation initiation factor IF-2 [Bacteroidales bacterium]